MDDPYGVKIFLVVATRHTATATSRHPKTVRQNQDEKSLSGEAVGIEAFGGGVNSSPVSSTYSAAAVCKKPSTLSAVIENEATTGTA